MQKIIRVLGFVDIIIGIILLIYGRFLESSIFLFMGIALI